MATGSRSFALEVEGDTLDFFLAGLAVASLMLPERGFEAEADAVAGVDAGVVASLLVPLVDDKERSRALRSPEGASLVS